MNRYSKLIAALTGLALAAAVAIPFLPEQVVSAKWLTWGQGREIESKTGSGEQEVKIVPVALDAETTVNTEEIVEERQGSPVRVEVTNKKIEKTVKIDEEEVRALQHEVNTGHKQWMLSPVDVVKNNAAKYGFDATKDSFTLMNQNGKAGVSRVLVRHADFYYLVTLIQPSGSENDRIWQIQSISEVRVVEKDKPDVGPGVVGLNYENVIAWQQNVDEGRELWRLDPMAVARQEGKSYGFTDEDTFLITKRYASTTRARHGEIHVKVNHNGKGYTMILVRPLGSDDGAIWTVYSVDGRNPIDEKPAAKDKVLYQTDKFAGWDWNSSQYLNDMAFATIIDYKAQLQQGTRIPASVLEIVKDIDYSKKIVLFAYLGEAPSRGYGIGIEKVSLNGNNMTVQVQTRSPLSGQPVTLAISHPADFVTIDRKVVDIWGGVNIQFVDEKGKVLSRNKLVISHR